MGLLLFCSWIEGKNMSTATAVAAPIKETKAQRAERLKQQKNPWECFEEIRAFARRGLAAVPDEWIKTYFRWWGVYTQGDGAGAIGGAGGEGKATPYFMLRIRLSNGFVSAPQLRAIAGLADKYAGGIVDITVRQNFQLHWITIKDLPEVLADFVCHGSHFHGDLRRCHAQRYRLSACRTGRA